ncbi:MAG: HugZ family protein [Roseitalea sp.]|nr:HugZ family protein [Roseitalea sp.]MBO6723931.1 HugZ family protein [Roseitalea sp.]MBO6741814.1 HugZ family protein [Roseitalea sp.]
MAEADKNKTLRETDDEAIRLAKTLIATARHAALAVGPSGDGFPGVSRVQLSTDQDGTPVILISSLSPHMAALDRAPESALLIGEPGKGDPLAHPRITLRTVAARIARNTDDHGRIRRRHLARHPKAALYADFGDFAFFRLVIRSASLNGGFGKAYELTAADLALAGDIEGTAALEHGAVVHMNNDHADAIALYAQKLAGKKPGGWQLLTIDSEGMDLGDGDQRARIFYPQPLQRAADLRKVLKQMADMARAMEN